MEKKFVIVGLGLIGGSMAMALKGFEDFTIVGVDVSQPTLRYAREHGICDSVTENAGEAVEGADVVMLACHPQGILDFLEEHCINHEAGGRLYFTVTEDGKPLRQRRYCFSEAFYALAKIGRASCRERV